MIYTSPTPAVSIPNVSLTDYLMPRLAAHGDRAALIDGPSGRTINFPQLQGMIHMLAGGLQKRGLQKGDIVAIYLPNLPEFAPIFYGTLLAGGAATAVNPLYTPAELAFQLRDTRARFLFTIPHFLESAQAAAGEAFVEEIFVLGEAEGATPFAALFQHDGQRQPVAINPQEDTAVVLYSSGTTGLPKGVMLTHHNLLANALQIEALAGHLAYFPEDVVLGIAPFFHTMGLTMVLGLSLIRGSALVTMPRFDLAQFLELIQQYRVTYTTVAPPIVLALAKHPLVDQYDLSSLRLIASGAAPLSKEVEKAFEARLGAWVMQGYGLTEASATVCAGPLERGTDKAGTVGFVVPNTEVQIVDVITGKALGPGERGELWLRGPQVMKGYLNNPDATAAMLDGNGWLHTGDIATIDEDNYIYIVDRLKELIKYKGFQVAPAELEAVLLGHTAVADACVIGKPDEEAGELPKAFIVLKAAAQPEEIMAYVAERVAPYKKIREIEFIDAIPKSPTGKILRRVLVAQERERLTAVAAD
ncbi:MAG TPA: 4-coumarate--CoA ligase family protein [Chloroflexota bacterium]|nr:4-coumarate--CoA ligase family protein [Chloroflexota bacterium]